jgi:hypothetical protein
VQLVPLAQVVRAEEQVQLVLQVLLALLALQVFKAAQVQLVLEVVQDLQVH